MVFDQEEKKDYGVEREKNSAETIVQHREFSFISVPNKGVSIPDAYHHDHSLSQAPTFGCVAPAFLADSSGRDIDVHLISNGCAEHHNNKKSSQAELVDKNRIDIVPGPPLFQAQFLVGDSRDHLETTSMAGSRPTTAKIEEVDKLTEAGLNKLTSTTKSLSIELSSHRSPAQPSLAPSPSFETISSSKAVMSDPEENYLRAQRLNEYAETSEFSSTPSHGSKNVESSDSNRKRHFDFNATSNRSANPKVVTQMPPHLKVTSSQSISKRQLTQQGSRSDSLDPKSSTKKQIDNSKSRSPSPLPSSIHFQFPPMSIPTYLQLELSSGASPLQTSRSSNNEFPFESTKIKFQRLRNFLILPPQLEQILLFGSFACLDAWLHTFTILPLRFLKAVVIMAQWLGHVLTREVKFISAFIYHGSSRMWHRQRERPVSPKKYSRESRVRASTLSSVPVHTGNTLKIRDQCRPIENLKALSERRSRQGLGRRNNNKSQPPSLSPQNKADLIRGILIISSCIILMKLDASRMYHYIRGQAAIKLYVIFNVLEVGDKLLAALGQDIFECLFSNEILVRDGRYRDWVFQSVRIFLMALVYNVSHAAALFFQVITLNVAVNSYSNALFTLLMSNQFVEIKSTVFKKIEKDNLFQLTCADVVERFQLCVILVIIALRNLVEMGSVTMPSGSMSDEGESIKDTISTLRNISSLPSRFSFLPSWPGEIVSPFLFVLGSEMVVDWIKHSYISKFNNVKPTIYGRYLDILAKDYYTNAFVNQNLVKRFGLPVIPLACLFIRSSLQTYHMFLATYIQPSKPSSAINLSVNSPTTSPATTAALEHFDIIIRHAVGRSTYGFSDPGASNHWYLPDTDKLIATLTMVIFFLGAFFVLLAFKLVLGIMLFRFAQNRCQSMKQREYQSYDMNGKRIGIWGMTEVDDEKKRCIYQDDPVALAKLEERQKFTKEKTAADQDFHKIGRYDMLKRIW